MYPSVDYVVYVLPPTTTWWSDTATLFSAIAAIASVAVALIALWFTRKQIYMHEIHNRKMATPHLSGWTSMSSVNNHFSYTISNNGLGPAIIKDIELLMDDNPIEDLKGFELVESAVDQILMGIGSHRGYELFHVGEFVPAGKSYVIIECQLRDHDVADVWARIEARVHIKVVYESIYEDIYAFSSRAD